MTSEAFRSIASTWRTAKVEDVCEVVSVGIVVQPTQYYVQKGAGVKAFRSANVGENKIIDQNWVYLSHEGHQANSKSMLHAGDVLVVRSGAPGTACVVSPQFAGSNCIDIVFARPRTSEITAEYLAEYTNSPVGRRHVAGTQGGLALKHFNVGAFKQLELLLPNIEEQRRIVDVLASWNSAIEKTERLIAAKERRLHFLYQKLFGLASRSRPGWKSFRLDQLLSPRKEYASPTDTLPLYSLTIEDGITPKTDRYDREFLVKDVDKKEYAVVHPGDIVFNPSNLRWGAIARSRVDRPVVVSPIYEVLSINNAHVSGSLLAHELTSPRRIAYFATKTEGTLIERMAVKLDAFLRTEIYIPSSRLEQDTIATLLDEADREIHLLRKRAERLITQKRGLMQKLLTGQWRVPVAESKEVADA